MYVFFLLPLFFYICIFLYQNAQYKKTAYYQITKTPFWPMDKGTRGEYLLYKNLRHFEKVGGKFLFNIYIPKKDGTTTELDAILICSKGLFVFESKNYSGWIFGDDASKNWMQTFPRGRGQSYKQPFYNPVRQNAAHIAHLRSHIGDISTIWSIIAFSNECTLKKITVRDLSVRVVNRHKVSAAVNQICLQMPSAVLTANEIKAIYDTLYPFTQTSATDKKRHIQNLKALDKS
jgi:hypothetical protein